MIQLTTMAATASSSSWCQKFEPNIFNKAKCQNCFKPKEQHSSEALESSKASRKISKCGYLFVAPDSFDFSNPMDRSRRWQRRFFVLYDDGELTYSVDENVNTIPQGVIDMNQCSDIVDAEEITGHQLSIAILIAERSTYIKGTTKDETTRWYDVLVMYPRSTKVKTRRSPAYVAPKSTATTTITSEPEDVTCDSTASTGVSTSTTMATRMHDTTAIVPPSKRVYHPPYRSVPTQGYASKKELPWWQRITRTGSLAMSYPDTLRQTGSAENVNGHALTYRGIRSMKHKNSQQDGMRRSSSLHDLPTSRPDDDDPATFVALGRNFRSRSRESLVSGSFLPPGAPLHARQRPDSSTFSAHGRTSAMAGPPAPLSLSRSWRSNERSPSPPPVWNSADPLWQSQPRSPTSSLLLNGRSKNETDEYKMAKSGDVAAVRPGSGHRLDTVHRESSPDVQYTKKGWLVKQGVTDKDWTKHWFVLNSNFLRYFRDSASEGSNQLDGVIDLSSIYRVTEVNVSRNYGFKLETQHGDVVLSAMTSGIRTKWMQALQACLHNYIAATSSATSSLASSPRSSLVDVRRGSGTSAASSGRQVSSLVDGVTATRHASSPSLSHPACASKSLTDSSRASSNSSDRTNFTCTWPYKKMEGGTQAMSDSSTGSHSRLTGYLDDDEGQKEDDQRDSVPRSVRSSHRRSTGAESLLRMSHSSKFETRPASSELSSDDTDADTGAMSKRRVTRNHPRDHRSKSLGVPPTRETLEIASKENLRNSKEAARSVKDLGRGTKETVRRKNSGEMLKPTLHPYRAPSAKVKEKSRSKSPRTKSPPPDARKKDGKVKRKESDLVSRPIRGTEGALIELLENQVGTLKTSLEKAQTELSEMTHTNTELKSQLHLVKQTHHSSLQDMTTADRSQYLAQAPGIHDDFYPVVEPQKISEFAKLQVQTLKQQLCETQNTARGQQQQIGDLHHKLDLTAAALATTEAELTQTVRDLKVERDELRATADDWSSKVERLTKELTERDMLLESKERELRDVTSKLREAKAMLDVKNDKIESLEVELHEVCGLKEELEDKIHQLDNLDHELAVTKQHLREQDEQMQRAHCQHQATLKEREHEFYREKAQLQKQVEQLRSTLTHPDLADTTLEELLSDKDETIAQLEEKLIEDNNKVQELSDELTFEMEDNDKMRLDLDSVFEQQKKVAAQLENEKADRCKLEKQIEVLKEGNKGREPELVLRCDQLQTELNDAQRLIDGLREENDGLKAAVDELTVSVDELKKGYEEEVWKNKELQGLLEMSQKASASNLHELAQLKINYDNVLRDLKNTNTQLESVQDHLEVTKTTSAAQLNSKSEELSHSQKQAAGLQVQLSEAQAELSTLQSAEAAPLHVDTDTALLTEGLPEELKTRYHTAVGEIKKLRKKLKDIQISREKLESNNYSLKQELKNMEIGYQDQLNQLSSKVHELTSKLSVAERRVRRLDRRSSRYNSIGSSSEPESENTAHSSPCGSIVTQANIQEALASIQQGVLMSMAENSSTCSSVASSVAAEAISQPASSGGDAEGFVAKITTLQTEIAASESKVQELTTKLLQHRELEVELSVLQQSEASLKVQSQFQLQQIDTLKQQLDQQPLDTTAAQALQRHLQETETKLASTQSTLDACRQKLCGIVQELTPEGSELANTVRSKLENIVSETKTEKSSSSDNSGNMKLFAERLALEATILGEMAHMSESCDLQGHDLQSVQKANLLLLNLEQWLADSSVDKAANKTQEEGIQVYTALLADKMLLQDKMTELVANMDVTGDDSNQESAETETVKTAARLALNKAELDLQLTPNASQVSTSVISRALVRNELHVILTQLSEQRDRTDSKENRQQTTEKLWQSTLQGLVDRQNKMSDAIESYRSRKLAEIGNLFLKKHSKSVDDVTTDVMAIQAFDRDLLLAEFTAMLGKFFDSYLADRDCLEQVLQEEKERFLSDLTQYCGQSKEENQDASGVATEASLDDAINSALMQLALVLAQKATVAALVSGVSSDSVTNSDTSLSTSHKQLMSRLQQTSQAKSCAALYLFNNATDGSSSAPHGDITRLAAHLAETDTQLLQHRALCESYAAAVSQEAAWQAELTYVMTRLNQEHQDELQRMSSQLTGTDQRDSKVQELRKTLEERTQELRHKEAKLADEIKDMKRHLAEVQDQLEHKEKSFRQEIAALKDGYEIRIRSLQQDLTQAGEEHDLLQAEHEAEQAESNSKAASITEELATTQTCLQQLQEEREQLKKENDSIIAALKDDIAKLKEHMTSSSAVASTCAADHSESLETEVSRLWKLLEDERRKHGKEVEQLRESLTGSTEDAAQTLYTSRVQEMQDQIQLMQVDYEQELELLRSAHCRELVRGKEEMMQLLAAAEEKSLRVDEDSIRKKYVKEIERIKQMYDKGFTSMEKSHHKVIMEMRKAHKRELDTLRQEKDQLLNEETKATQSALESMRNAHEAELQAERNKFLDMIVKTYSQADVESLQHQHEDDLDLIQGEINQISEQYSIKVLECATLEERLDVQTKALHQSRKRVQDLIARNEELNTKLKHEIQKLNRMVANPGGNSLGSEGDSPEVNELRVALKIKEAEIHQLQEEIKSWKEQLHDTVEELEDSMEMYHDLYNEHTATKQRYDKELVELREKLQRAVPPSTSGDEPSSGDDESYNSSSDQSDGEEPPLEGACAASPPQGARGSSSHQRQLWRQKDKGRAHSSPYLVGSEEMLGSTDSLSSSPRASTSRERRLSAGTESSLQKHPSIPSVNISQEDVRDT